MSREVFVAFILLSIIAVASFFFPASLLPVIAQAPTVVVGPTPPGSVPTSNPVFVAGQDPTTNNLGPIGVNQGGYIPQAHQTTGADGKGNTILGAPIMDSGYLNGMLQVAPYWFNNGGWDRQWICGSQAVINATTDGNTQLIPAVANKRIRICYATVSTGAFQTLKITQGTGLNCSVGTSDLAFFPNVSGFDINGGPWAAVRTAPSQAVCLNQSQVTQAGGVIVYSQY